MLRLVRYIPVFLLLTCSITAQVIKEFDVKGNRVFDDDDYVGWSGVNTGEKFYGNILDTIKVNIADELGKRGYLQSSFDVRDTVLSPDSQNVTINVSIDEGDPTYINHFIYTGADSEDTLSILPFFDFLEGEILKDYQKKCEKYLNKK